MYSPKIEQIYYLNNHLLLKYLASLLKSLKQSVDNSKSTTTYIKFKNLM